MMFALFDFLAIPPSHALYVFGVFCRISASLFLLPAFGERIVPTRIKLVLSAAIVLLIFSFRPVTASENLLGFSFETVLLTETMNGLLIGFTFRCLVFILQICGTIAAQSVSLSQSFGAGLGIDPQPAFSTLLVTSSLALLTLYNWHILIVDFYLNSFFVIPFAKLPMSVQISDLGIKQVSQTFAMGLTLATPFVLVSIIYNLGLGFINKAMPQLMVAFIGAPAISLLGLALLFLGSPVILAYWMEFLTPNALNMMEFSNE